MDLVSTGAQPISSGAHVTTSTRHQSLGFDSAGVIDHGGQVIHTRGETTRGVEIQGHALDIGVIHKVLEILGQALIGIKSK